MKRTKGKKRQGKIALLCALSVIAGLALGFYLGWRAGLAAAPPIIFMAERPDTSS